MKSSGWVGWAWALAALLFYLPLLIPSLAVIEPDDLLDSELVYNRAIGAMWRGDPSIAHAFLVGHVPVLTLSRLTQPLMALYALLPPLQAYVLNDLIVRAVAAIGAWLLLHDFQTPRPLRHLLAALFAFSLTNTTYGLSIAGLPAALWLLAQPSPLRLVLLLLISWNSSIYLSGIFFLAAAPLLHILILQRPFDRAFAIGLLAYAAGLVLGNFGLILLALKPHPVWHRVEWAAAWGTYPFPWRTVARPLLPFFALAAVLGFADRRARYATAFGFLILAWYALMQLPWFQLHRPYGIQVDRLYYLWPLTLLILAGLASTIARRWKPLMLGATLLAIPVALTPHQHLRQLVRTAAGTHSGYPPFDAYYHTAWFRSAHLDAPVVSVGLDPMAAPMNGVPSIDGYFPVYPVAYKHAFQRVYNDDLISSWGSKLYAKPDADFCVAQTLGARHVLSPAPLTNAHLQLTKPGEINIYRITC